MYTNNYSNSVSTNSLYKVYSWMVVGLGITAITSVCFRYIHVHYSDSNDFIIIVGGTNFTHSLNGTSIIT